MSALWRTIMVQMFMRDFKKVSALECPLWRGFVIRDSLGIRPGQNFLFVLERCLPQRMSALGRFHCIQISSCQNNVGYSKTVNLSSVLESTAKYILPISWRIECFYHFAYISSLILGVVLSKFAISVAFCNNCCIL